MDEVNASKNSTGKWVNISIAALLLLAMLWFAKRKVMVPKLDTSTVVMMDYNTKESISFSDFPDKVIVLNFWQTWCGPCIGEMASLNEMSEKWKDIQVIAISNESAEKVNKFVKAYSNIYFVQTDKLGGISGITQFPTTYIYNKQGTKVFSKIGPQDWSDDNFISNLKKNWE